MCAVVWGGGGGVALADSLSSKANEHHYYERASFARGFSLVSDRNIYVMQLYLLHVLALVSYDCIRYCTHACKRLAGSTQHNDIHAIDNVLRGEEEGGGERNLVGILSCTNKYYYNNSHRVQLSAKYNSGVARDSKE